MTYKQFINNIIRDRGQWNIPNGIYYENHHIIPRCLGGLPKSMHHNTKHKNLIWLTAQEHFIAHKLLALENPTCKELCYAWHTMCHLPDSRYNRKIKITKEEYAESHELYAKHLKESVKGKLNPMYGRTHSDEVKIRLRNMNLGKKLYWWNDGVKNTMCKKCPGEGWKRGRLCGFRHKDNSKYFGISKGRNLKIFLYRKPDGSEVLADKGNTNRWHKDWILIKKVGGKKDDKNK